MNSGLIPTEQLIEARIKKELCVRAIDYHERQITELREMVSGCDSVLAAGPAPAQADLADQLAALRWQSKNEDQSFSWVFNTARDGSQLRETAELARLITDHDGRLELQGYEYSLSENRKFLQRRKLHS